MCFATVFWRPLGPSGIEHDFHFCTLMNRRGIFNLPGADRLLLAVAREECDLSVCNPIQTKFFGSKFWGLLSFNAVCVCSLLITFIDNDEWILPVQKKSSSPQNVCHVSHYLQHTAIGSRFHTTRPASKPMCTQVSINNVCPKA